MFLNAVVEEKLWGAQNFLTIGILGAQHLQYSYIKVACYSFIRVQEVYTINVQI